MRDKKGVSDIVITVIMVVLVLAAITVVWAVVNNLVLKGAESAEFSQKCIDNVVKATSASCVGTTCTVNLQRTGTGTEAIGGVRSVAVNSLGARSAVSDSAGDIAVQGGKQVTIAITSGWTINKIESSVYFTSTSGTIQYCTPNTFTF